jgi:hypothetical protein
MGEPQSRQLVASNLNYGSSTAATGEEIAPASARKHDADRPEAEHARTFKLDHSMGVFQWRRENVRAKMRIAVTEPISIADCNSRMQLGSRSCLSGRWNNTIEAGAGKRIIVFIKIATQTATQTATPSL